MARLIGAPPGYVGYEAEGQLTGALRRTPYCVVLLDELEKAHPDVLNLFLQLFEDGRLTDAKGRTVDASNALCIATSNAWVEPDPPVGFRVRGEESLRAGLVQAGFRRELIDRFDDIILFAELGEAEVERIASKLLAEFAARLKEQEIEVQVEPAAVKRLCQEGYNRQIGARNLRRVIERRVENEIAGKILRGEVRPGHIVVVDAQGEELTFAITGAETV